MEEVDYLCDQICIINNGKIISKLMAFIYSARSFVKFPNWPRFKVRDQYFIHSSYCNSGSSLGFVPGVPGSHLSPLPPGVLGATLSTSGPCGA